MVGEGGGTWPWSAPQEATAGAVAGQRPPVLVDLLPRRESRPESEALAGPAARRPVLRVLRPALPAPELAAASLGEHQPCLGRQDSG